MRRGNATQPRHCDALAYFITFTTYGTWLHGDDRGSVDREHNIPETPTIHPDAARRSNEAATLKHAAMRLGSSQRRVMHETIERVCSRRGWPIHALNVRSNHIHLVVTAAEPPEQVMNALKSWGTRDLVGAGLIRRGAKVWTRHGSTRYLWKPRDIQAAGAYVSEQQGCDLDGGD